MADSNQLYPVFDIPDTTDTVTQESGREFLPAPLFDYEKGDFVRDGANRVVMVDGRDAYRTWAQKILKTQVGACLSYIGTGIDIEGALKAPTHEAVQSMLERTISEALLSNPCTERVYNFSFAWDADVITVRFTIQPKNWAAFDIEENIV